MKEVQVVAKDLVAAAITFSSSMAFTLSVTQIVVISSVINGLVYAGLVLFKKENQKANYFLCALLISLTFTFTPYVIDGDFFNEFLWFSWLPLSVAYWVGPFLYFYVQHLTRPKFQFKRVHLWHFSLIILNYLHSIYHALSDGSNPFPYFHVTAEFLEFSALFSIFIYAGLSYKTLTSYSQSILDQLSNIEKVHLRWLIIYIKILAGLFVLVLIYFLLSNQVINKTYPDEILVYRNSALLLYALTMYWLSIGGYRQSQTLNNPIDLRQTVDSEQLNTLIIRMKEGKFYLDPDLSLKSLSKGVGISEKEISTLLNRDLQKNFYVFVNEFRVEAVKAELITPANDHLKIISIAFQSGFNSKATFTRIFKRFVGKSPQEFKENR